MESYPQDEAPSVGLPDLVDLCRRLNEGGVQYLIYGGKKPMPGAALSRWVE